LQVGRGGDGTRRSRGVTRPVSASGQELGAPALGARQQRQAY
jgi:hypothetical protein